MKYKTRGDASPQGKPRVYFTGHPADVRQHFESITDAILKLHNCAIFYDEDPEHPEDGENFLSDLDRMQLIVVVVTSRYVYGDTFAHSTVFRHAMERHIPVLPILEEGGIERDFDKKCGDLQYLDPNARDGTAISFEEKLKKFLDSVLVGDELAAKVRAAFDAYVFLSYRKKDRRYAQQLMRLIHQTPFCRDIAIWYDEFLVPGENFNDAIRKAMEKSELFALVVTPNLLEDPNYIMSTEYPAARESGKPILPAVLVPTKKHELKKRYKGIPKSISSENARALTAALKKALENIAVLENDGEPQHMFFIGLAYLGGIDVEVNYELAVRLITQAAEAGLPEAMKKLVSMYRTGEGVERDYLTAVRWQEKLAQAFRAAYEAAPDEEGGQRWFNTLRQLGDFWYELRQLDQADKTYCDVLEAGRILNAAYHARWTLRSLAVSYSQLGVVSAARGDLAGSKTFYEKSLAIFERLALETGTEEARADLTAGYNRLGNNSRALGDLAGARDFYGKSLAIIERLAAETDTVEARRSLSMIYTNIGGINLELGDLAGAKVFFEKSLAIFEQLAAETGSLDARSDLAITYQGLGDISQMQGDLMEARVFYEKRLAIREQLALETGTVEAQRELAFSYTNLGENSQARGDLAGAKDFFGRSLAIRERLVEETGTVEARRDLAFSYTDLGDISQAQGDSAGAKVLYEKSLVIRERLAAEMGTADARRELSVSYGRLGDVSRARGNLAGAKIFYEKSIAINEELAAETGIAQVQIDLSATYIMLGDISAAQGDLAGAKVLFEKGLIICEQLVKKTNIMDVRCNLAVCYGKLADISRAQRDLSGARSFYQKSLAIFEELAAETDTVEARWNLSASYDRLGDICRIQEDLAGARVCCEKSLAIFERLAAELKTIDAYDSLAMAYLKLAAVAEEQQEYLRKAAAIWSRLAAQCPGVRQFQERLALVRKFLQ